jgi:hypothetical protein
LGPELANQALIVDLAPDLPRRYNHLIFVTIRRSRGNHRVRFTNE